MIVEKGYYDNKFRVPSFANIKQGEVQNAKKIKKLKFVITL